MVFEGHRNRLVERHALLAVSFERQQHQCGEHQHGKQAAQQGTAQQQRSRAHQPVEYRDDEEREQRRDEESADDDRCQRALHFGPGRGGDGHGHEAQRGDQSGQEDGAQQVLRAAGDDAAGRETMCGALSQSIEVVYHQNTV